MKAKHRAMIAPAPITTQANHAYSLVIYQALTSQHGADKGHRDDGALEPHRPHVGKVNPEQVNVRHANERADLGTGILFGQLFEGRWP